MPAIESPFFGINYGWTTGEDEWGAPVNKNFQILSTIASQGVDEFVTSLPLLPIEGKRVVLTSDKQIYVYLQGSWTFIAPVEGQELVETLTSKTWRYLLATWTDVTPLKASSLSGVSGASMIGYNAGLTSTVTRTVEDRLRYSVNIKDYNVVGDGVTDDTIAWQKALDEVVAVGKCLYVESGLKFLVGALTFNVNQGGSIFCPGQSFMVPNANNIRVFSIQNYVAGRPGMIEGVGFNNLNARTGCVGFYLEDFYFFNIKKVVSIGMGWIVRAIALSAGSNAYNLNIDDVIQIGKGSFEITGQGTKRCFDVRINNVNQFTTGGDTWEADWFNITRGITVILNNVHGQSLGGMVRGVNIVGQCEGIFLSNVVIPWPTTGLRTSVDNGDVIHPAWIYVVNAGFDQPTVHGIDATGLYMRITNCNVTGGTFRTNSGSALLIRPSTVNFTAVNSEFSESYNDGLTLQSGATGTRFVNCEFRANAGSGSGFDVNIVAKHARDPLFTSCRMTTINTNASGTTINGGNTSRYVTTLRAQASSAASASNQVLRTTTVKAGSFVDTKSIRIIASGLLGANGNSKTVTVAVGGVNIGTFTSTGSGTVWRIEAELHRFDSANVWIMSKVFTGTTSSVTSSLSTPFNSAIDLVATLLVTGTAAGDVVNHIYDVELVD